MERIAFHIPFLNWPITWYGLMIATGFMAGYGIMIWRARQLKFPLERVADVVFTAVLSGLVGARVLYVITYWQRDFSGRPITDIFAIHRGGLVFYGGFFGGAIAMIILCRIKKLSLPTVVDLCALGLPLAHMFGRFGCFLNGCCHGRFTTGSLGFRYPIHEITPGGVGPPK
jgi:phosphatidylglycerol:prolipoprotein diacylglycerol transferase